MFTKYGGNLGGTGSVSHGFKRLGVITISKELVKEDDLFEFIVDNGSEDLEISESDYIIYCDPNILHSLNEQIINRFGDTLSAGLTWKNNINVEVQKGNAEKLFKLLNTLEENEDVQNVSSNFEVSEKVLATLTQ